MSDAPNQDLPVDVDINVGNQDPAPNQDLPDPKQPPRGPDQNRGRDEDARREAPGQQDKDDK